MEAVPAKLEVAAEEADAALEVVAAAAAPAPEDAPAAAVEEASGDAAVEAPAPPEPKSAGWRLAYYLKKLVELSVLAPAFPPEIN